jgi:hypothetical protein
MCQNLDLYNFAYNKNLKFSFMKAIALFRSTYHLSYMIQEDIVCKKRHLEHIFSKLG